jgi:hypothetical protein
MVKEEPTQVELHMAATFNGREKFLKPQTR